MPPQLKLKHLGIDQKFHPSLYQVSMIAAIAWWHHQMKKISTLLVICVGNSLVTGDFPSQSPVMQSFDASFELLMN